MVIGFLIHSNLHSRKVYDLERMCKKANFTDLEPIVTEKYFLYYAHLVCKFSSSYQIRFCLLFITSVVFDHIKNDFGL